MFDAISLHELLEFLLIRMQDHYQILGFLVTHVLQITRSFSMAADNVVDGTMCTSIHFEYASSSILPRIGPA